ncbi:MAG: DNA cytosine methyltransferase [Alphaproteobacteria bacterium]|nr:DNA cytosine methyltransferase [Alphaproteobacteria bacterium]
MARLGLGEGWTCALANEWDAAKAQAYRARFGAAPELRVGDVADLAPADLPGRATLAWASFPCQDLSLAGARRGLAGARSGTFFSFWRLIEGAAVQGRAPAVIALENVVGALTSHDGRDFEALVALLSGQGYRVGALVIDAVRFLPQSRPRLFVIAVRDRGAIEGLTAAAPDPLWTTPALARAEEALPDALRRRWVWWRLPAPPPRNTDLAAILEPDPAVSAWHRPEQTARLIDLMGPASRARLDAMQAAGARRAATLYRRTRPDGHGGKIQRAELRCDGIAGCLRTPAGGSSRQTVVIVEGERVRSRLLTGGEAARLMGVPDDYPIPKSATAAQHLFGDGVAVPVVRWLAQHLLEPLADAAPLPVAAE